MAEPSAQQIQEQVKQAQQSAWAQAATQMPPAPAMAPQSFPQMMPSMPQQPQQSPAGSGVSINMGKLSLLGMSLSLMMLGAFTFLGGFLLGIWFSGPKISYPPTNIVETYPTGMTPQQQQYVHQQQPQMQPQAHPSPITQGLQAGAASIGFGQIASGQARNIAQTAVTGVTVPGVPSFLSPLVTSTQYAIGQQLGYKAQQQVGQQFKSAPQQAQQAPAQPGMAAPQPMPMQTTPQQVAPTPQPTPPIPTPMQGAKAGDEGYTIQLGVFAAEDNAQTLVNHLKGLNFTSHVVEGKAQDGGSLYYVNSGLYPDYKTATEAASQFATVNIPGALIVKVSTSKKGGS